MSIFRTVHMECPNCETPLSFELALSVNAGRRPEQRRAILEGSFQRETCPACATNFRVDPQFTYVDLTRRQYIGVWPQAKRGEWQACAERTRAGFDAAYGRSAPAETGILSRASVPMASALRVVCASGALPCTVVIATNSRCFAA